MTGKQKMAQVVKHFDAILKLYPDNSVGLDIHKIDPEDVSNKIWRDPKKIVTAVGREFTIITRKPAPGIDSTFDITLFTKEEI